MSKPIEKPDIELVYDHYQLRIFGADRGGWRKAECPLPEHEDRNPSASVDTDEQKFWCHACNEGGDGLDIIMRRENARLPAAQQFAAQLTDGTSQVVRQARERSGLLPRRSGSERGGGTYVPPWLRR